MLLIVGSECFFAASTEPICGLPYFEPTADDAVLVAKRQLFDKAAGSVVLLGDSSCMMGLQPATMEDHLDTPVLNLGTLATHTIVGFETMAVELLEAERPPKRIVIACLPRALALTEEQAREQKLLGRYLAAYNRRSVGYTVNAVEYAELWARKHRLNRFPSEFEGASASFFAELQSSKGYYPEKNSYAGKDIEFTEFRPSDWAIESLRRIASSASRRNVPVDLWFSPCPNDLYSETYFSDVMTEMKAVAPTIPNLRLLQATAPSREPSEFGTETHLKPSAAIRNSEDLARAIRSREEDKE